MKLLWEQDTSKARTGSKMAACGPMHNCTWMVI